MTIFFNHCFDKGRFRSFLIWFFKKKRDFQLFDFLEKLKILGFHEATETGFSISIDDLKIPFSKSGILLIAENKVLETDSQFSAGNLTIIERYQQIIEIWNRTNENCKSIVIQSFQISDLFNPVYLMAFSGARGNISQIQQLVGMRGLMADPQGQIIDFPIRSNFREGLTLTEYLISCSGARKGIVDTALRTAASGYLTRRLVDIAHEVIISQIDCQVEKGIFLEDLYDKKKKILPLKQRLIGRILAESVVSEQKILLGGLNQEISKKTSQKICQSRQKVLVRSPLTCQSSKFICQLCYGWNLAEGQFVSIGEAVGVLAAQSIGEPGTQLTMRTFHTGGVFTGTLMEQTSSPFSGKVFYQKPCSGSLIRTPQGQIAYLSQNNSCLKIFPDISLYSPAEFSITNFTLLYVRQGEHVFKTQLITELSDLESTFQFQLEQEILAPLSGEIYFENLLFLEKTISDFKTIQGLGEFWILFGKFLDLSSTSFFRKFDLVTNKIPLLKIIRPQKFIFSSFFFKKIGYFRNCSKILSKFLVLEKIQLKENVFFTSFQNQTFVLSLSRNGFVKNFSKIFQFSKAYEKISKSFFQSTFYQNNPEILARDIKSSKPILIYWTNTSKYFLLMPFFKSLVQEHDHIGIISHSSIIGLCSYIRIGIFVISKSKLSTLKKDSLFPSFFIENLRTGKWKGEEKKAFNQKIIWFRTYQWKFWSHSSYINRASKFLNFHFFSLLTNLKILKNFEVRFVQLVQSRRPIFKKFKRIQQLEAVKTSPKMKIDRRGNRPHNNIFLRVILSSTKNEILSLENCLFDNQLFYTDLSDFFSRKFCNAQPFQLGSFLRLSTGQLVAQTKTSQVFRKGTTYLLNNQSILHVQHGEKIVKNQKLWSFFSRQSKTGDIVQGIPRIEEIFEARKIMKNFNILNIQKSVVNDIQKIYCGQGIHISDKHIEIIVRQMSSNAIILEPGSTGLLCGEVVPLEWISRLSLSDQVVYQPIFMGMTKTCLETSSFISAASFQETTRVLSRAALQNQMDFLRGLKQNVILGNLSPIGTGCL